MNNILQKRILELTYQNNLLREEIEKIKKNLNEVSREKREELEAELWHEDHWDFPNRGYRQAPYMHDRGSHGPRPSRDFAAENKEWHGANVRPLIDSHGLGEHADKLDEHGVPHAQHLEAVSQHPQFGAYVKALKVAHEKGFADSKARSRTGKGSRYHVEAFGKIKPLLRRS